MVVIAVVRYNGSALMRESPINDKRVTGLVLGIL